jgi:hypothetical protein
VNGPVGGTRFVGVGDGIGDAVGLGLVVSDGLGVGAADTGPENSATDKAVTARNAGEFLRFRVTC